ncbi:NUDIX hydrolase [Microbacterium sp. ARD32]|uniref:NUDIX hydrolase n=1 Tax=Microbacterium sp. ARD32 TaxID=2962577 RepID=UPI0028827F93|nr:NUDIX hydrolase [Microbacterium sp. ARD32]MDT0156823.1 NUDIX hydrolase [Microbacterium sp. ARD32]
MTGEQPERVAGTAVVLRDGAAGVETLMLRRPARGSFAGAWVFPGGRVDPGDWDGAATQAQAARAAAVRETREEAGIRIADATPLSRWTPPPEQPVRYVTWFFLARDVGDEVVPNPGEIEQAEWMAPEQALAEHVRGGMTLFPPTWVTLNGLLGCASADAALAAAREPAFFRTRMGGGDDGGFVMWAGDEQHPDEPGEPGRRHRLLMGEPPWTYLRD